MSLKAKLINDNSDQGTLSEEFMSIALSISDMLKEEGKNVRPFLPGLPHFSKLSNQQKVHVIQQVRFYQELCQEHRAEGMKINDNLSFVWRAFCRLGLAPCRDFFTHLTQEDIVEIYSKDQLQLFRNFKFFDHCSYTLEELHTIEWWNLFERTEENTKIILGEAIKALSGEIHESFVPNVPIHSLREANSAEHFTMEIELRRMAPVYRNRQIEGVIVLERARLI
ncbi:MAG: hypothetical protein J7501_04650 [Bdellovibrio sp.]|nr:hypothetical protein [Bdellovibrio sp.]